MAGFRGFWRIGARSANMHEEMGELIKSNGVVRLLAVGADAKIPYKFLVKERLFLINKKS